MDILTVVHSTAERSTKDFVVESPAVAVKRKKYRKRI
jgi:hypothetical protein